MHGLCAKLDFFQGGQHRCGAIFYTYDRGASTVSKCYWNEPYKGQLAAQLEYSGKAVEWQMPHREQ